MPPFEEEDNNPFGKAVAQMEFPEQPTPNGAICSSLPLLVEIVDANKTHADGVGFVTYTIAYNGVHIRRRYREFELLRKLLVALFPTVLVPPIPTKQSLSDMLSVATQSKTPLPMSDVPDGLVDHRRRMLALFLRRCLADHRLANCAVLKSFLSPTATWKEVLSQPPLSNVPKNPLQCDPSHPEMSLYLHTVMPVPGLLGGGTDDDGDATLVAQTAETATMSELDRVDRRCARYLADILALLDELGVLFNAFLLEEVDHKQATQLEKVLAIYNQGYLNLEELYKTLYFGFTEPLIELLQYAEIARKLIRFKSKKRAQIGLIESELKRKEKSLKTLTVGFSNWKNPKLDAALNKFQSTESRTDHLTENSTSRFKIPGVNKLTAAFKEHVYDTDPVKTHEDKVNKLIFDISQLKEMKKLAESDYEKLEKDIDAELKRYDEMFKRVEFRKLMKLMVSAVLEYGRKSLEAWEEFQKEMKQDL